MKRIILVLNVIVLVGNLNAQEFNSANEYLQNVLDKQKKVTAQFNQYVESEAVLRNKNEQPQTLKKLEQTIREVKHEINMLPAFQNDETLIKIMSDYLAELYRMVNEDYAKLEKTKFEAQKSYLAMKLYVEKINFLNKKYEDETKKMLDGTKAFANKNNIGFMVQNVKYMDEISQNNDAYDFFNDIFIRYFRALVEINITTDAVNRKDTVAILEHIDSLRVIAEEESDGRIISYKNNYFLDFNCTKAVEHCKSLSNNLLLRVMEYYRIEKNKEEAVGRYEAIPRRKVKQKDIDELNLVIDQYNKATQRHNSVMKTIRNTPQDLKKSWNTYVVDYFSIFIR